MQNEELIGKTFGSVTVIKILEIRYRWAYYLCKCACGNYVTISKYQLMRGNQTNCGCKKIPINTKHGCYGTRLYRIWNNMKSRCNNKNTQYYKNYGEKGVKVCKEWSEDFISFKNWALKNGYADNLSIDRIDVNGNYEPANCRWVNAKVQANNKSNNHYITYKGETHTISEWSEILSLSKAIITDRLNKGKWSIKKTFETPIDHSKRRVRKKFIK